MAMARARESRPTRPRNILTMSTSFPTMPTAPETPTESPTVAKAEVSSKRTSVRVNLPPRENQMATVDTATISNPMVIRVRAR